MEGRSGRTPEASQLERFSNAKGVLPSEKVLKPGILAVTFAEKRGQSPGQSGHKSRKLKAVENRLCPNYPIPPMRI